MAKLVASPPQTAKLTSSGFSDIYAAIGLQDSEIVNLRSGQAFTTYDGEKIGIKTAVAGTAGDIRAYSTGYIDTMIGDLETLLAQI